MSENEYTEEPQSEDTPLDAFFRHQRKALEETGKALDSLLPPDFKDHSAEAGREFAKGFRILIDAAIDELKKVSEKDEEDAAEADEVEETDNGDGDPPSSSTGKTKVRIELD